MKWSDGGFEWKMLLENLESLHTGSDWCELLRCKHAVRGVRLHLRVG